MTLEETPSVHSVKYNPKDDIPIKEMPLFLNSLINTLSMQVAPLDALKQIAFSIPQHASVIYEIYDSVAKGVSLASSLSRIPELAKYKDVIELGFKSGKSVETLQSLLFYYNTVSSVRKKIDSVLKQPTMLTVAAALLVIFAVNFMFPKLGNVL
jgi:type II secretory pathway component PulF